MQEKKVFDVLLVSTSPVGDAPDLLDSAPPVDETVLLHPAKRLRIDRVQHDLADSVMKACEPAGMTGRRQWGSTWGFFRDDPPISQDKPFAWDIDRVLYTGLALSRLIQPSEIGTEYAARILEKSGTLEIHPGPVTGYTSNAFVAASLRRRWLTKEDALALASLVQTYDQVQATMPARLRRALWNHDYASYVMDLDIRWVIVATALEALTNIHRRNVTAQFRVRVHRLAVETGLPNLSEADAGEAYHLRSHLAHGGRLARVVDCAGQPYPDGRVERLYITMEEVLRRTIRRAIEDETFRAVFEDDTRIRTRWPV